MEVATNGTTYAVAGLEHLPFGPFGRTTLGIEFRRAGQPAVRLPLDIATLAPGRLKLTVVSDDTGKQLAREGDALLERVALARNLYEELKLVAEAEREPRRLAGRGGAQGAFPRATLTGEQPLVCDRARHFSACP